MFGGSPVLDDTVKTEWPIITQADKDAVMRVESEDLGEQAWGIVIKSEDSPMNLAASPSRCDFAGATVKAPRKDPDVRSRAGACWFTSRNRAEQRHNL